MTPSSNSTPQPSLRRRAAATAATALLLAVAAGGCPNRSADVVPQPAAAPRVEADAAPPAPAETATAPDDSAGVPVSGAALPPPEAVRAPSGTPPQPSADDAPVAAYDEQGCVQDLNAALVRHVWGPDLPPAMGQFLFEAGPPPLTHQPCNGDPACHDFDGDGVKDVVLHLDGGGGSGGEPLLVALSQNGCWRLAATQGYAVNYEVRVDPDRNQLELWSIGHLGANTTQEAFHRYQGEEFVPVRSRTCEYRRDTTDDPCGPWVDGQQ